MDAALLAAIPSMTTIACPSVETLSLNLGKSAMAIAPQTVPTKMHAPSTVCLGLRAPVTRIVPTQKSSPVLQETAVAPPDAITSTMMSALLSVPITLSRQENPVMEIAQPRVMMHLLAQRIL